MLELLLSRLVPALVLTGLLGSGALARGAVSGSGALGGLAVGVAFYLLADWPAWLLLAAFFISSSLLGLPGRQKRKAVEARHERGGRRSWHQVLANTGPMLFAALVVILARGSSLSVMAMTGLVAGFAAAASDTWAGEVGILSKSAPRMILGFRKAEAGQSGAVTLLGLGGALGGSLALSALGLPGGIGLNGFLVAAAWGFVASLIDSILGGSVQALYQDAGGGWTERSTGPDGRPHRLVRGFAWCNNDLVNLVSVTCAVVGASLTAGVLRA